MHMQPALLRFLVFPPPAPGAEIFADCDRARARRAADARHELVVQEVERHIVRRDVVPHVVPAPVGERIDLGAALVVDFGEGHVAAVVRLLAAQAGNPRGAAGQHACERLELAQSAAGLAQVDALVHRALAVGLDEMDDRLGDRLVDLDFDAVALRDARDQRRRFGVQHAGLERAERDRQCVARDQVGEHHVFGAEARRLNDASGVFGGSGLQHVDRVREACFEAVGAAGIQRYRAHIDAPALTEWPVWGFACELIPALDGAFP